MLGLPFITEFGRFKGKIYATDPTVQLGRWEKIRFLEVLIYSLQTMFSPRLYMEELVEFFERSPAEPVSDKWKDPEVCRLVEISYIYVLNLKPH